MHMNSERLDDAKYAYTKGWATIQAIADRISVIAHGVNPLDPSDRDWIHDQLREVYDELCRLYVLLVDEAVDAMNRVPKAGDLILDDNRYMDGSQVWTSQPPGSTEFPVQAIYCGDLGPDVALGCEVIVADPPHWRRLKAQAPRQDGDSAFKDLKARLLEVIEAER
jgi:hypothetical protein